MPLDKEQPLNNHKTGTNGSALWKPSQRINILLSFVIFDRELWELSIVIGRGSIQCDILTLAASRGNTDAQWPKIVLRKIYSSQMNQTH